MLNLVCYVWVYYNWLFVFDCICAVLRGSLLYISCGLSGVKTNVELLLELLIISYRRETAKSEMEIGEMVCDIGAMTKMIS